MVMDLSLPDGSGYDLLEHMAGNDDVGFPPVIVYTGRALNREEEQRLRRYSKSIIIKGARSPERLLDEVTLFLHSVEASLPSDQQRLLRGGGGLHHGRGFNLSRARLIGRGSEADIAIDDPAFAEQHARVEVHGERVLLRDLGSADGTRVNGVAVRHCWLQAGDQVVFDGQHRFVLEVPHDPRRRPLPVEDESSQDAEQASVLPAAPRKVRRWPWLLASALLLAALHSLLLWFGAR
ncbi:hypothetical protein G6F40_014144 [Rhizopus arrhizus]|nr:hypothetical protein G6F40_014144 [Rhizopus arrhizus]